MPKVLTLTVRGRDQMGRGPARRLRKQGLVPGVLYGGRGSFPIALEGKALVRLLQQGGERALLELQWEDRGPEEKRLAVLQEIQRHPISDLLLHVDFHEIKPDEPLHAEVEVVPVGTPAGIAAGGMLETVTREVRIQCLPRDLPEALTVDVSHLGVGESLFAGELPLPAGVRLLSPPTQVLFTVVAPEQGEEVAEAAAPTEPELVRERKETEGEEESS
ncbi:50S ribosomal protein L25 [Candidatus Methylacidithermus pantelleriae]|uniref:Large ribosomal subunit protein bL25 n=1 Tax=Candidatus Methylacidithermus pantelleriae TaxID=2744239 RepID=A0A8J2BUK0_9BACT|nr:50S ribosomal protein L25 [Candidatus Methylacidithermus pantelleriae]CAF0701800.1 50S ribosomal protein L25 [Candidatus Methylacidithermus pantelleriae]